MCLQPLNPGAHTGPEEAVRPRSGRQRQPSTQGSQASGRREERKAEQMRQTLNRVAIPLLQWVVGLVVLLESFRTLLRGISAMHLAQTHGIHPVILIALAAPEMV